MPPPTQPPSAVLIASGRAVEMESPILERSVMITNPLVEIM